MGPTIATEKEKAAAAQAQSSNKKLTRLYPNYIRSIAAFAVVQMHSVGGYLYQLSADTPVDTNWMSANVYYSFLRWATPFFIMLSGSFMLSPKRVETTREFLHKRIVRVMLPFAFWAMVYLVYQYRGNIWDWESPDWSEVINLVLFGDVYYHLWFIPMILGMYLLTPTFLSVWTRHATRFDIEFFLVLAFSITMIQHFWGGLFLVKYIGWLGYVGFYVLGYYLTAFPIQRRKWIYVLGLLAPFITAYLTWKVSTEAQAYESKYFVYFSPNVVLMSVAWFLYLRNVDWTAFETRYPRANWVIGRFAQLSFGVYFVHVLLIDVFKNGYLGFSIHAQYFFAWELPAWIGTFLQAIFVTICSAFLIAGLERIPGMKKWVM